MGQVLRINFNQIDYKFKVLNEEPMGRETEGIFVQISDVTVSLVKRGQRWIPDEGTDESIFSLAEAIAKAIALRFRI